MSCFSTLTHLLWFVTGDGARIGPALRARLEAGPATVSTASLWELAIKSALGKLTFPDDLPARVEEMGFEWLPVTAKHGPSPSAPTIPFHGAVADNSI